MDLAIHAHPADLQALADHGDLRRLADLGFTEIVLAASYHAGRWLTPWQDTGRVRFLEDGVVHFHPRGDYGELQPLPASEVRAGEPSPLERWCKQAAAAGLRLRAWLVGTHNSRLGRAHPGLCIENAHGDRYRYGLCPAQPPVQQYLLALVRDVAAHQGLGAVEFEAFGWFGYRHSSHHDKASFAPRGLLDYALSLCCCPACARRFAAAGADPQRVRAWARKCIESAITAGDAMAPGDVPPDEVHAPLLEAVQAARAAVLRELAAALAAAAPPPLCRAVQVHPEPLFCGSQLPLAQAAAFPADDERVLTVYGEAPEQIAQLLLRPELAALPRKRLCLWPKAPQFRSDAELSRIGNLARERGFGSLAVYHLGLLPWRTIERAARAFQS